MFGFGRVWVWLWEEVFGFLFDFGKFFFSVMMRNCSWEYVGLFIFMID